MNDGSDDKEERLLREVLTGERSVEGPDVIGAFRRDPELERRHGELAGLVEELRALGRDQREGLEAALDPTSATSAPGMERVERVLHDQMDVGRHM